MMDDFTRIILDGCCRKQAYCTTNGNYTKLNLSSAGKIMQDALEGFECVSVMASAREKKYELAEFENHAMRICRYLGKSEAGPESTDMLESRYDVLVICGSADTDSQKMIDYVKKTAAPKAQIIYIMPDCDGGCGLMSYLADNYAERLTIITNSDVLRRMGMDISFGLSWESTLSDMVWQVYKNSSFRAAAQHGRLIVRMSAEGAAVFDGTQGTDVALSFIPDGIEGDLMRTTGGEMLDLDAIFSVPIVKAIMEGSDLELAAQEAVSRVYGAYLKGYNADGGRAVFCGTEVGAISVKSSKLTLSMVAKDKDWTLLESIGDTYFEKLARDVVRCGMDRLCDIPSAKFANLTTVDRKEIERFRAIRNLMEEYLKMQRPPRPLSVAVFGRPGSGKSFGVTQVAKCIGGKLIEKIEFNLSQLNSKDELSEAFHKVRDIVLSGKVPLVFFDEFDSAAEGVRLGWLKSFLAPMQDGEFTQNGQVHPIGKCIFIFAGGVYSSFEEFCGEQKNTEAKVRDFISRIKGYVDIQGPNPAGSVEEDSAYILRRAVLLRSMIERKLPKVKNAGGTINVDPDIIKAMLKIPEYRHGARSIESVIDMSAVFGKEYWDKSDLPPADQLKIHVDEVQFKNLLLINQIFSAYREDIAMAIHDKYRQMIKKQSPESKNNLANDRNWDELSEEFRNDNRLQADDIIEKLMVIDCSIEPLSMSRGDFKFKENEVEHLAEKEHTRWMNNKLAGGWVCGDEKDTAKKTSPFIKPWDELLEETKELDRVPVRAIPELLERAGLGVYRLK